VLLSVMLGMRESYEDWQALGRDLIARGLGAPMLIVADGAPGLIKAIEQCWPDSDRQHCAVHRLRNLLAKLPEPQRDRVRQAYWQALDDAINPRDAKQRLQSLVDELKTGGFSSAARCLADDLDALVVHLRYPIRHRRRWRSTNLLERSLGEVKRRTKVMGRFPGEDSCLTLVWAVLDLLITHETNGIRFTQLDRQHLNRTRYTAPDAAAEEDRRLDSHPNREPQPPRIYSAKETRPTGLRTIAGRRKEKREASLAASLSRMQSRWRQAPGRTYCPTKCRRTRFGLCTRAVRAGRTS
jgi:transposase-like protein